MLKDKSFLEDFDLVETLTDDTGEKISGGVLTWGHYSYGANSHSDAVNKVKTAMKNAGFKVTSAIDKTVWGVYRTGEDILAIVLTNPKWVFFINEGDTLEEATLQHSLVVSHARVLNLIS